MWEARAQSGWPNHVENSDQHQKFWKGVLKMAIYNFEMKQEVKEALQDGEGLNMIENGKKAEN